MKSIPSIERYMTAAPITIGVEQSLEKASKLMYEHQIRHLPVLKGGQLVGILSDRDIKMVTSLKDVDPTKVAIEEALTADPFTVSPKAPLNEVCAQMAEHKFGSVLVLDNHKLVGIFTWVDALYAFQELLDTRLKK
ncbi:MAG: CBS domain-containing protein [Bdellovibrionales bacterium]|nr:CBS domain-containing protein [Bdellovibrionales bacterium]